MEKEFVIREIQRLDDELDQARILVAGIEKSRAEGTVQNEKLYIILQEKIKGWETKRNLLVELLIQPLRK